MPIKSNLNFILGMGSVLSILPAPFVSVNASDVSEIRNDWVAVGKDIDRTIQVVDDEQAQEPKQE